MIAPRRGARAAALTMTAALAVVLALGLAPATRVAAVPSTWALEDSATFEIYQDDRLLGLEEFRVFRTGDTLIVGSALRLDGRPAGSRLPRLKNTTFLRHADSSYPIVFQISEVGEDTTDVRSTNCVFQDTTVVIYKERGGAGGGNSMGLPPGRLYLLEPGMYSQVQTLAGDFVQTSQDQRKQPVLIPSAGAVVDILLTRGPRERLGQEGHVVETTRIEMTDAQATLVAWVDDQGRMWKLEAPGQGLRVERTLQRAAKARRPAATARKPRAKGAAKR